MKPWLHSKDRVASIFDVVEILAQRWQTSGLGEVVFAGLRRWLGEVVSNRWTLERLRLTDGHREALTFRR